MAKNMDSLSPVKPGTTETIPPVSTPLGATATAPVQPVASPEATPAGTGPLPEAGGAVQSGESFDTLFPEPTTALSGPPRWIWWILLVIGSAGLGLAAYSLLNNRVGTLLSSSASPSPKASLPATALPAATATPSPSPTPSPVPAATSTPAASVTKSAVTLRVLNGTTVAGAAGKAKTVLENGGFTVQETGNAANQTYATTVIYYQSGRSAEAKAVQTALTGYSSTLEESSVAAPSMVLVVVGLK